MADKIYLDAEGVKRIKEYIDDQIESLQKAIDLLNGTNETPGSIQNMIDDAINALNIEDLNQDNSLIIDGGEAPKEDEL